MMKRHCRWIVTLLVLLLVVVSAAAQETYTDGAGRFSVPIPQGWTNLSTDAMAHFANPDGTANVYVLTVEADALQAGILAALEQIYGTWSASIGQSSDIPLPGGVIWTQNIYVVEGEIVAAVGRQIGDVVYVLVVRAPQAVLAAVTPAVNGVLLGHAVTGGASVMDRVPEYVDAAAFTEQDITVGTGEWALPGTLTLPVGEGPFPALVLVHGSGPNDRDETLGFNRPFRDIAQGLATRGIAVLRYDKRTFAYGERLAGMDAPLLTIDDEVTDDALAAVMALRDVHQINPARIFVLGHSQGGMLVPRIVERDSGLAGAILLAAPARTFRAALADQLAYILSLNPAQEAQARQELAGLLLLTDQLAALEAGGDALAIFEGDETQAVYWQSMIEYDHLSAAQGLEIPLLVLQAERDYQVTMADYALWQSALADLADVTFISYPDLQHLFMALGDLSRMSTPQDYNEDGFVDAAVIDDIAVWILAH